MSFTYKKASIDDIDFLTDVRIEVLKSANQLSDDVDMSDVRKETYRYYQNNLENENHCAYLVFFGEEFVGAGAVSFFEVMPTYHNPSGKKAYIMNMYTKPNYRRRGSAYKLLDILVNEARNKKINAITLEATSVGRPLYEKYGFISMKDEMELPTNIRVNL
ncbi:MAG: GNAT family N-acetyltransferase [Eubacteriales bacterium]